MASAFVAFSQAQVDFSLAAGGTIDRFSVRGNFPFRSLPMGAGMLYLLAFGAPWVASMACLGVAMGLSGTVRFAIWDEPSGVPHLGSIWAMMASIVRVGTAASPALGRLVVGNGRGVARSSWGPQRRRSRVLEGASSLPWGMVRR